MLSILQEVKSKRSLEIHILINKNVCYIAIYKTIYKLKNIINKYVL